MKDFGSRKERQSAAAVKRARLTGELMQRLVDVISEGGHDNIGEIWVDFIRPLPLFFDLKDQMVQHALLEVKAAFSRTVKALAAMTPEQREAHRKACEEA